MHYLKLQTTSDFDIDFKNYKGQRSETTNYIGISSDSLKKQDSMTKTTNYIGISRDSL